MPARSSKFGLLVVTKLKDRLVRAPDREVAEVSKQGVIDRLVPELLALHARGYTWPSIAALLADEGVQISGTALGAYVRRGSSAGGATKDRSKRKRPHRATRVTAPAAVSTTAASPLPTARLAGQSDAPTPPQRTSVDPPAAAPQAPTLGSVRSSFTPRRHSEDI